MRSNDRRHRAALLGVAGAAALLASQAAHAQDVSAPEATADDGDAIVVTGVRGSLERAADIKRDAAQVLDSIVAQDIGRLPDPTTAAALQRVPGVQVSVNRNNELGDVRVRGLPDVLTTVNGREIFTTTGRKFDLNDLPAEALSRIDAYKSQTPDLIEGGLAGVIDLKLNKPFSFTKPTIVASARSNWAARAEAFNPQFGALATDRWDTGIGEIGVLVNATWSRNDYRRDQTTLSGLRSTAAAPLNTAGYMVPNILQNFPEEGRLERTQVNAALQWQASPALLFYADGLYTRSRDRGVHYGANVQPFTTNVSLTDATSSGDCFRARVTAAGQNPTIQTDAAGNRTLQPHTVQNLCYLESGTFNNIVVNQTTQARDIVQENKLIAGGASFEQGGWKADLDVSYQTSKSDRTLIIADIGQRLSSLTITPDVNGIPQFTVPGDQLLSTANLSMRNSFQQQFGLTEGDLFAAKVDVERELGGFLSKLRVGGRYARRAADSYQVNLNTALPGGNIGTATEARAVLVSNTGLPSSFLSIGAPAPGIDGGQRFYVPNPDYLLSDEGQDALRAYVGLPLGRPDFQKVRQFNAEEDTFAAYAEIDYEVALGGTATLDGVVGGRYVRTERDITTFVATNGGFDPLTASTTDQDFLPTATARLRFQNGLQARLGYSRSIRRPEFGDLNPAVTLSLSNNPFVQSSGSAGNPDLRQQESDSYDATLEYYFRGGYIAVAGYYREISDRVINGAANETFNGVDYSVTRPRNLGSATLKGIEISGQYFLDFLPGPLSGLGVQGAFTLADSKIGGDDPLAGNPLQGVSKYNFTSGLLYEKGGLSGRLVYTYRSKYFESDQTGSISVRPIAEGQEGEVFVPTLLSYVRPAGRLDFSVGYDINPALRLDVGGTNILRNRTKEYLGQSFAVFQGFYDETSYTIGLRVRL
ncbi:TonB-dependent receptor [Sphingomonas zeicaulis]|uniref:TonB-dependent receptor n=1 Tax=Sphingomonas zeicaulis TaxID=1632740 RepID=UPI003D1FA598